MFWVTMTDKFMSGWGGAANKINKFVVACESREQAEQIVRAAEKRSEMKYISVRTKKPKYGSKYVVSEREFSRLGDIWRGQL